jgi:hypothetical protein
VGWPIRPGVNVVLEGEHDERYFRLADHHSRNANGLRLLGDGFEVFASGTGPAGGTHGIMEHFHTVFRTAQLDLGADGRPVYRLAVLLDDDKAGREASRYLTARYTGCVMWRDVFLLQRCYPTGTRDLRQVERRVRELNSGWRDHYCEIGDLLPKGLIDLFHEENSNCYARPPVEKAGRWHYEFAEGTKGALCTHVEHAAMPEDLQDVIGVIGVLRFFLSVEPAGGSPTPPQ